MRMVELAEEYDRSYQLLRGRIKELQTQLTGYALQCEQAELQTRIRDLTKIAKDMKAMRDVCRDYYEKGAYLDGSLTTRYISIGASRIVSIPLSGKRGQHRPAKPIEKKPATRDSGGPDAEAARNAAAAIFAELFSGRNQSRAGRQPVHNFKDAAPSKAANRKST